MKGPRIRAVVADMDGVITRTAAVHERAWKRVFDAVLSRHEQRPFEEEDYRRWVDGKPRLDGVRDFLGSRGIELPEGEEDRGSLETVRGIGEMKNAAFHELLEEQGVEVFDDALEAFARWRRAGLPVAVVSASRNCRPVLRAAGIEGDFEVIVDGEVAAELGLADKAAMMREAARRLGLPPANCALIEDAVAGVRAARQAGMGYVVGVARGRGEEQLREAGAEVVVSDLRELPMRG